MTEQNISVNPITIPQDPKLAVSVEDLARKTQTTSYKIYKTTPPVRELQEGQIVLYDDGTNKRIYAKINNALYYVNLTAV